MVRKLILEKLVERGLTMKSASLDIGQNHSYLYQFIRRGTPVELGEYPRARLATLLDVSEDALRGPSAKLPAREYGKKNNPEVMSVPRHNSLDFTPSTAALFGGADLPVFGTASGGQGGALVMSGEAVDYVVRPAPLLRVKDGYGMIVTGDSMSPQHENGSTALVNPHLPPRNGDTCVFRSHQDDGTVLAMIKKIRRFTDETWFVTQFNPKKDYQLKRSEWQICHVTVGNYFP